MSDAITESSSESIYRWYVLTLAALTFTISVAIPSMAMPVLFGEISKELNLNLVQVGWIWGIVALTGVLTGLVGGTLGDKFGTKRILVVGCVVGGVTGALRGMSPDYTTLVMTSFLFGLIPAGIPMNVHKVCGIWFAGPKLGLANGVVASGMAFGFMLGSAVSASILSPWLGGWRPVLYLYGGLSIIMGILWAFTRAAPAEQAGYKRVEESVPLKEGLPYVCSVKNVWLVSMAMLGMSGCIQGALGYIPLYLRQVGWTEASADGALAMFHGISLVAAIPLALLSDRLGTRRKVLMVTTLMIMIGIGLLSVFTGPLVWVGVVMSGMARDGFMAIMMTMIIEIKAIGAKYAGTAIGLVLVFSRLGNLLSPPVGNSLAQYNPALPFLFWSLLAVIGLAGFYFFKEGE
jgi:NNP family nitrate/nitrite transporter-like MFS transporter